MAQIPRQYRMEGGSYLPNNPYATTRPYYDPEGLTILFNNELYHPTTTPLEIFDELFE